MNERGFRWAVAALAAAAAAAPFALGPSSLTVWVLAGVDTLVVLGLVLLMGFTGQPSICQGTFYGIGAYGVALGTVRAHWPYPVAAVVGIVAAAALAAAIGGVIFRLRGHFLALATVGVAVIAEAIMSQSRFTGGAVGISGVPPLSVAGHPLTSPLLFAYLVWGLVLAVLLLFRAVVGGPGGLALRAIRNDESAARSLGIQASRYKLKVFAVSAAVAALAGVIYAPYVSYVSAGPFGVSVSIQFLLMASIGGMGDLFGAVLGTLLVTVLGQSLTDLATRMPAWPPSTLETIVFGALLVTIVALRPQGLLAVAGAQARAGRRGGRGNAPEAPRAAGDATGEASAPAPSKPRCSDRRQPLRLWATPSVRPDEKPAEPPRGGA